jgi:hypothetical protein
VAAATVVRNVRRAMSLVIVFLPASFVVRSQIRIVGRNRFIAPLRSPMAQCASLIAPYFSVRHRRA